MDGVKNIVADLRRRSVVDQKISHGLRVRKSYLLDRHSELSYWHLRLAANAWNIVRDIRTRFPEAP